MYVNTSVTSVDGVPIGPAAASPWLLVTPQYFPPLLHWVHNRYPNLIIYVTENGVDVPGENSLPMEQALNDTYRIEYLSQYITGKGATVFGRPHGNEQWYLQVCSMIPKLLLDERATVERTLQLCVPLLPPLFPFEVH